MKMPELQLGIGLTIIFNTSYGEAIKISRLTSPTLKPKQTSKFSASTDHWLRNSNPTNLKVNFSPNQRVCISVVGGGGRRWVGSSLQSRRCWITLRYQKAPAELTGLALGGGPGREKLQSVLRQHRNNSHPAEYEQVSRGGNYQTVFRHPALSI